MTTDAHKTLLAFSQQASQFAQAIEHEHDLWITGIRRKVPLEDFLPDALELPSFSLMEYRYQQTGNREPGLRFRVEHGDDFLQVHVQWFHDLLIWDVNQSGQRIFEEPIWFDLKDGDFQAHPHPDCASRYTGCPDWQSALEQTLRLPLAK